MLSYDRGQGENENWILAEDAFSLRHQGKCESVMHLANGYVGVRSAFEESYPYQTRGMFVAGSFDKLPGETVELPNAADTCGMDITLEGEVFSMCGGVVENYSRQMNLRTGEVLRQLDWTSPLGRRYHLAFRRFVSWADKRLYAQQVTVQPLDGEARVRVVTGINARTTNSGAQHFCEGAKRVVDGEVLYLTQTTGESEILFVHGCVCRLAGAAAQSTFYMERRHLYQVLDFTAGQGAAVRLEKISTVDTRLVAGVDPDALMAETAARLRELAQAGYETLWQASAAVLADFWRESDIRVATGIPGVQLAIRYAQYSLMAAMPPDASSSIAAKGLSGEGYKGHVFWDTEVFMLPYFLHTRPGLARRLLEYRIDRIGQAMENAAGRGWRGIMFPWESAATGAEETPPFANMDISTGAAMPVWAGEKEHHITADVAFATWNYWRATGDDDLMHSGGALLVVGCALFWASRATWVAARDRYEILDVVGPDEYTEHVDNNAYTNHMAWQVGRYALEVWDWLPESERRAIAARLGEDDLPGVLARFCDKLYLPKPGPDGVLPQDDTFLGKKVIDVAPYRAHNVKQMILKDYSRHEVDNMQVLKQADAVMLTALYPRLFPQAVQKATWNYYEPKTIHDSSLSHAIYALAACGFGAAKPALASFLSAMDIDIGPNPESSDIGIHAASMSGVWMDIVQGFAGLRRQDDKLWLAPCLPEGIDEIELDYVFRGRSYHLLVGHGALRLDCKEAGETEVYVYGRAHRFNGRLELRLEKELGAYASSHL